MANDKREEKYLLYRETPMIPNAPATVRVVCTTDPLFNKLKETSLIKLNGQILEFGSHKEAQAFLGQFQKFRNPCF